MSTNLRSRYAVAVGPFPPPVNGLSLITERFVEKLGRLVPVEVCNVGVGQAQTRVASFPHRLGAALNAARLAVSRSCGSLYIAVPGGYAILLLLPLAMCIRIRQSNATVHHNSFAYINRLSPAHWLFFEIIGDVTHIHLCPRMARDFSARYRCHKSILISNWAFVGGDHTWKVEAPGPVRLAHLSNLSVEKGLDDVLAIALRLNLDGIDVRLRLGGAPTSSIESRLIEDAAIVLGDRLELCGPVSQSNLAEFFTDVSVFIFPSRYRNEAEPLVVLESLSCGVPTLTSNVGCLPEIPQNVVVAGRDMDSWTSAVLEIAQRAKVDRAQVNLVRGEAIQGLLAEVDRLAAGVRS